MNAIQDSGIVVAVQGDMASVKIESSEACHSCGAAIFCKPAKEGRQIIQTMNSCNAAVGDRIRITEAGHTLLKVTLIQYTLPLIGFLTGILVSGYLLTNMIANYKELLMLVSGITGLVLSGLFVRIILSRMTSLAKNIFVITPE